MFIKREISSELLQMCREYPVVTVMGPRQAGKTTLVRNLFKHKPYLNMELPDVRQLASTVALYEDIQQIVVASQILRIYS